MSFWQGENVWNNVLVPQAWDFSSLCKQGHINTCLWFICGYAFHSLLAPNYPKLQNSILRQSLSLLSGFRTNFLRFICLIFIAFTVLCIYFSAVLSLLLWKHERWATTKLELHPTQRGHAETSEPPRANRHNVISKPFLPPSICPSAGGKAAEQRRYCSVQAHSWHRSPTAAWKLGREHWCWGPLNSCMGHAARGCPAAAGRGSKSPSHLLSLSGSTKHSPIWWKLEWYQGDFSPSTSPSINRYRLYLVVKRNDPGTG